MVSVAPRQVNWNSGRERVFLEITSALESSFSFHFSDKVPYVFTNFAHISLQICLHILIHLKSLFADDSSGSSLGLFLLTIFSPIYGSYFLFLIDLTAAI